MHFANRRALIPGLRLLSLIALSLFALSTAALAIAAEAATAADAETPDVANPVVQLIRDPLVQEELGLSAAQIKSLDAAYARIAPRLWKFRDVGSGQFAEEKAQLLASFEPDLDRILQPLQRKRLSQLEVRARGWPSIVVEPVASQLKLTPQQIETITGIIKQTRAELQKVASSSSAAPERQEAIQRLRTQEGQSIQEALTSQQRQALQGVVGAGFDLGQVQPLTFEAPELQQVDAWVNSPPLKLANLRGKVTAFHFWAFNCGNCINNLPHYNKWHEQFADQGLVVLGMHTPETMAERNVDSLRGKVDQYSIEYPVAVDHDNQNWGAWANSMWPSVYLVDKQGRVRYWWYGEMNWQGTEGEKFMRQRIEQLLAETE